MSAWSQALLWGAVAALPLVIGALAALRLSPSQHVVGLVAAFGAGALISALSFDLVLDASEENQPWLLTIGLATGAIGYWFGRRILAKRSAASSAGASRGLSLLLGSVLDGVPESFILGLSVAAGVGVSVPFLVAVAVSNLPEGMTSTEELKGDPQFPPRKILTMWTIVVIVSSVVAGIGGWLGHRLPIGASVLAEAFAAGALLTMITDDLIPDADDDVGPLAGLAVALGFAVAFGLHQLSE